MVEYHPHPAADVFPLLAAEELDALAADIAANGLANPIVLCQGQVLDGRNRLAACRLAGVSPRFVEWQGRGSPIAWVLSQNLHRRHLDTSQRAMVAAKIKPLFEAEARQRQIANLRQWTALPAPVEASPVSANLREREGKASEQAARALNVSSRSVEAASTVLRQGTPALVRAVEQGVVAVSAAAAAVRQGPEAIEAAIAHKPHVANNSGCNDWYTPSAYLEAARAVLGGIDLDPASCPEAQANVKATTFYTAEIDGLAQAWRGRVWMNPPYAAELIGKFAAKLAEHFKAGEVTAAVVLVNNATDTQWFRVLADVSTAACFPTGRVRFLRPGGVAGALLQGQAILYMGQDIDAFKAHFGGFGWLVTTLR